MKIRGRSTAEKTGSFRGPALIIGVCSHLVVVVVVEGMNDFGSPWQNYDYYSMTVMMEKHQCAFQVFR